MEINVSVQYNGGLLPDILYCRPDVVTLGNPFDPMKRFMFPPKPLDTLPLEVNAQKV